MNKPIILLPSFFLLLINVVFSQRELVVTENNSDNDAVIEITGENPSTADYKNMIIGFNQSSDAWIRTTTNHDLSLWTDNTRRMTVKKDGKVGIGTSSPSSQLDVQGNTNINGNLQQIGIGNTLLESQNGDIIIKTANAQVVIDVNGNILVSAAKNISIDAGGELDIEADKIRMISGSDIDFIAANDINLTASDDITSNSTNLSQSALVNHSLTSINYSQNISSNLNQTVSGTFDLNAGFANLDAAQIVLNGGTQKAARVTDVVNSSCSCSNGGCNCSGTIATGSSSVFIGN